MPSFQAEIAEQDAAIAIAMKHSRGSMSRACRILRDEIKLTARFKIAQARMIRQFDAPVAMVA